VITHAEHWRIIWAAMAEAVRTGEEHGRGLAEAAARMISTREGANAYEIARAYTRAETRRSRHRPSAPSK
jgi:hypothetical protein